MKAEHLAFFSVKCTSYIVYLLIGLYFSSKCRKELDASKALADVGEEDFRRIFEFHNDNQREVRAKPDENKVNANPELAKASFYSSALGESTVGAAEHSGTLGKMKDPKAYINRDDFEMFYIMLQSEPGFQAYKAMKWWPLVDLVATYGHFATNLLIVIMSTCFVINVYTMLNLGLVCYLYLRGTVTISRAALEYLQQSGL